MSDQFPPTGFPPPSFAPRRKPQREGIARGAQAEGNQAMPPSYAPKKSPAPLPPSYAPGSRRISENLSETRYMPTASAGSASNFSTARPHNCRSYDSARGQYAPNSENLGREYYGRAGQYLDPSQSYDPNWERKQIRAERQAQQLKKRKRIRRTVTSVFAAIMVFVLVWPMYLYYLANSQITRLEALSQTANTSGETWLIAGSDTRIDTTGEGEKEAWGGSGRTDTLMLVRSVGGKSQIVSLPRDTAVVIPGRENEGLDKLNAAYYYGGPKLLIATVEKIIGTKVDHYVQVSMTAVPKLVDAVGTINLCYEHPVKDPEADLDWPGGCHDSDGKTALAFARTRKYDPLGDFGRQQRQRQVISKLISSLNTTSTYINPLRQYNLTNAAAQNLAVDNESNLFSLVFLAWTYKNANAAGLSGVPPIADADYYVGGHGSKVLLSEEDGVRFWQAFRDGNLSPEMYHQFNTN